MPGRPRSAVSKLVLSLPHSMPVKDVLAKLKAAGLKSSRNNVYRVRRSVKSGSARKVRSTRTRTPNVASSSAESILRAVAAEIGLGRALDILHAERSKVRALLG